MVSPLYNIILLFVIGLVVGSFLNVLILRIDELKTVLYSRSHCPSCKKTLRWYDLVPLLSFILLYGKCRYCGKKISWQYPAVELFTAVFFVLIFVLKTNQEITWALPFYLAVFSLLVVVFVYDLRTQMVPEIFVWIALILSAAGGWYFGDFPLLSMVYGGLVGGGLLAFLVLISKERWMGAGDIKIGLILGFLVGFPVAIFSIFLSFFLGAIAGIIYMKIAKKGLKDSLPFAPFLILATFFGLFYGKIIMDWYISSFLW